MLQPSIGTGVGNHEMETRAPARRRALIGGVLAITLAICVVIAKRDNRSNIELSLSRVVDVHDEDTVRNLDFRFPIEDTNDDVVVVMRVRNPGSDALMLGKEQVQPKVGGRWRGVEEPSWLNSQYFVAYVSAQAEKDFVVAVVPSRTESVRLLLEYHHESLAEKWHQQCLTYDAHSSRFLKLAGTFFLRLDGWVMEPLRKQAFETPWPSVTIEFELPQLRARSPRRELSPIYLLD